MIKRLFQLTLLSICPLFADALILDNLQGIVLLSSWNQVRKEPVDNVQGVVSDGVCLLKRNPDFLLQLHEEYIDKPLSKEGISTLKEEIANFYRASNQPLVVVSIPRQEVTKKILQVVVEEAKLGKIYSTGNCYFPTTWLSDEMRATPGECINAREVFEDVSWLNLNPFRRTDAIYKPGAKPGTTDIELVTIDRWPYRIYAGADNTGTKSTNRNRMFFGFNFGKSVLKDGQISYQFTSDPDVKRFYSHTASARLPLPWRHVWVFWGGYAEVKPRTKVPHMKNKGVSWQMDTRYRIPVFLNPDLMQTFVAGYDFKETNNDILYNGENIYSGNADISQFMLGYELGYRTKKFRTALTAELYASPGKMSYADRSSKYRLLRYGANCHYVYFKVAHSAAKEFRFGNVSYDFTGQISSANLLPSEQFTMTGYNAVRGFKERILNLDNAAILNLVYETPRCRVARFFDRNRKLDELYLIAFFDGGIGGNHRLDTGESAMQTLGSVGPGIRYQMDRYITLRFDYGMQLWHSGFESGGDSRYNFGLILSY